MKYCRLPLIATLSLLVACGDKSPTDVNAVSGTVSFEYTGAVGAPFSATGGILSISTPAAHTQAWATGWSEDADNSTLIVANMPRTGGIADFAIIIVNSQTSGTSTIDPSCVPLATTSCNVLLLGMGATASGSNITGECFLESGTITISSISNTNVAGSFSGSGICFNIATPGETTVFTVTNGSFDVPLQANAPL